MKTASNTAGVQYATLDSGTPLRSSQPLRVVLVTTRALTADGSLARLESRFPQAGPWQSAAVAADAAVEISWSDLDPARMAQTTGGRP